MSNKINLRLVETKDAQFIIDLRTKKGQHLSKTDPNLQNQINWIKSYKEKERDKKEFYYIIESKESKEGKRLGVVRIYDLKDDSFCWGSWIIDDKAPKCTAITSALLIYKKGFHELNFPNAHFEVDKENKRVKAFHERMGAKIIGGNDNEHFFTYSAEDFKRPLNKYKKFLK